MRAVQDGFSCADYFAMTGWHPFTAVFDVRGGRNRSSLILGWGDLRPVSLVSTPDGPVTRWLQSLAHFPTAFLSPPSLA